MGFTIVNLGLRSQHGIMVFNVQNDFHRAGVSLLFYFLICEEKESVDPMKKVLFSFSEKGAGGAVILLFNLVSPKAHI